MQNNTSNSSNEPEEAYDKALRLGLRIPELELIICKNTHYSYCYAKHVIKGKWELGEPAISKNVYYSYCYALYVIKGRWELGEAAISKNAFNSFHYAKNVIKGRLPDFMHNALLLSNDEFAKEYVKFIQ